jgi:hypothetical protein
MKITEIVSLVSRSDPMEKYQWIFDDLKKISAFGNLKFAELIELEDHYLGLFNNDNLIAFLHLEIRTPGNRFQISYTETDINYQGQGCFRYLINTSVNRHSEILSDTHQTDESKNAWKSLIKHPSEKISIYVLNMETKNIILASLVPENEIWNEQDSTVLLIRKNIFSPELLENWDRNNTRKKKNGRDYDSLFYGSLSSSKDYINP